MAFEMPLTLRPVWRFAVHVVIGAFAFLIVYMVAVGVDRWVDWTAAHGAPNGWSMRRAGCPRRFFFGYFWALTIFAQGDD